MRILLGVSGSIAAYKAIDILRALKKEGHEVKVALTKGAQEFVRPQVFSQLGACGVWGPEDDFRFEEGVLHVELARWAQRLIVAPLSANTLALLAQGQGRDLLTCCFLAYPRGRPMAFFPAMNTKMWEHPFVAANVDRLKSLDNVYVDETQEGELACGDVGGGRLASVEKIALLGTLIPPKKTGLRFLISTGATASPLDGIRYLSTPAKGLTGYFLAREALARGHMVSIVAGHGAWEGISLLSSHPRCEVVVAPTVGPMARAVGERFGQCAAYISAAAISDIEFEAPSEKWNKQDLPFEQGLPIRPTVDILQMVAREKKDGQKVIGFAAQTQWSEKQLRQKQEQKNLDLIIGTKVSHGLFPSTPQEGLGCAQAQYMILGPNLGPEQHHLTKRALAVKVFDWIETGGSF